MLFFLLSHRRWTHWRCRPSHRHCPSVYGVCRAVRCRCYLTPIHRSIYPEQLSCQNHFRLHLIMRLYIAVHYHDHQHTYPAITDYRYAKQRQSFGKPISTLYAIQEKIADMSWKIDSARSVPLCLLATTTTTNNELTQ